MFRMSRLAHVAVLTVIVSLAGVAAHAANKRLILKDGSYQVVTKYEVKGDRVRYMSAERYEWEEIPLNLIDWAATEKWEKERAEAPPISPAGRAAIEEERRERAKLEAQTPLVSPGIRLPATGGVFMLDVYQGQPQIAELTQNGSEINRNTGTNILRAAINPLAKNTQTIELKGTNARVQSHVADPFIYVNLGEEDEQKAEEPQKPELPQDRFRIVRLEQKKDKRVLGKIKTTVYTGKSKQEQTFIEASMERVSNGPWVKITPAQPLQPGEYAVVEMLGKDMNLYVWDFGVNPNAPANPGAWKPNPAQQNETAAEKPVLKKPEK